MDDSSSTVYHIKHLVHEFENYRKENAVDSEVQKTADRNIEWQRSVNVPAIQCILGNIGLMKCGGCVQKCCYFKIWLLYARC